MKQLGNGDWIMTNREFLKIGSFIFQEMAKYAYRTDKIGDL